jgi:hypothetical protein
MATFVSSTKTSPDDSGPTSFTCFPDLPTEIRLKIWKHACFIPRNMDVFLVALRTRWRGGEALSVFRTSQRDPATLYTNKESRTIALKFYTLEFGSKARNRLFFLPEKPQRELRECPLLHGPRIYLDPFVDYVFPILFGQPLLPSWPLPSDPYYGLDLRYLAINMATMGLPWYYNYLPELLIRGTKENIETVYLYWSHDMNDFHSQRTEPYSAMDNITLSKLNHNTRQGMKLIDSLHKGFGFAFANHPHYIKHGLRYELLGQGLAYRDPEYSGLTDEEDQWHSGWNRPIVKLCSVDFGLGDFPRKKRSLKSYKTQAYLKAVSAYQRFR